MDLKAIGLLLALGCMAIIGSTHDVSASNATANDRSVTETATQHELNQLTAPIKSRLDLDAHIRSGLHDSPLRYLSAQGLRRFASSITFNHSGVTGFSYEDIERELTATQAYEVLALIGQQHFTSRLQGLRSQTGLDQSILDGSAPGARPACFVLLPRIDDHGVSSPPIEQRSCDGFLKGFRCSAPGNCAASQRNACTSNC